ncbi:hypothetical protein ACPUEK_10270 [Marinomonas gallaica]|uniref:hypothetical protein n=1 Tax=Marinomonas gallaica TaxID=1806667 RepID=UPI003CE544D1
MNYTELKARHRAERADYLSASLSLRLHRSLSWLKQAEISEDDDSQFIFLWIAFNAAYAQDSAEKYYNTEKDKYSAFIERLVGLDANKKLYGLVWSHYSSTIRSILNNEFILADYWRFQSGDIKESDWMDARALATKAAHTALANNDTTTVLSIILSRLYVLRNQIMHGGATHGSKANRKQLTDCTTFMSQIVPLVIELMMAGQDQVWGDAAFPLIDN